MIGLLINFSDATLNKFAFFVFLQNLEGKGAISELVLKAFANFLDSVANSFCIGWYV
jgi:hypothetical protein